ncbi:cellulose biosynthesis cyclic di-GMP-binding regulatory protein BcsB [Pseudorhodobacter sp.]|uniref:cellulose biosynthesis cyclic di-GMP-binding regulatory protein BcsB n=1 Tax=Pseudorhodobacter sp. TaxID=1934400 RepID=UPI0039E69586
MTVCKIGLGRLVVVLALALATSGPVSAQTGVSPDDPPMIDLDAVLDAPVEQGSAGGIIPAPPPEVSAPPLKAEILDESLLTLPVFARSDAGQEMWRGPSDDLLLPLHAGNATLDGIVRLTGEVQSEAFYVDLPQSSAIRDMVLSYRVSIYVLSEQSRLAIRVNGVDLPIIRPDAFEGFKQIILPGALLTEGQNEIIVTLNHVNRIFCGPDATFDVWTEIDTNTSGVRIARGDLPMDAGGMLMALRAQLAMAGHLPVRLTADMADERVLEVLTQRLMGLRGGGPVLLASEQPYGVADGPAPLARITVIYGPQPSVDIRRAGDGTVVLLLTMGFDGALPDLEGILPLPAPVANNALLSPGLVTPLRDLGFVQTQAFNRYTEQKVTFRLPDDWLLLASQKAMLQLNYSFIEGLAQGALMLVKMNGTTIRMLPLDRDGGNELPTLDVDFRARLLRPGANVLTFVTIVPGDPPGLPCPPTSAALLQIGDDSTLLVPPSPRMQMADIARTLTVLRSDQIAGSSAVLAERGATNLPAILAAALRPVAQTERLEGASLNVTFEAAEETLSLSDLGVSRRDLLRLFPALSGAPSNATAAVADETTSTSALAPDVLAPGILARGRAFVQTTLTQLRQIAIPDDGPLTSWLIGREAEAALFIPRNAAPNAVWLMVRPQSDPLRLAAVLAQARLSAEGPRGRFSILTADGTWQNWHSSRPPPALQEPLTVANFRTVAGNYASWSPLFFGALLLALTLVSGCLALIFLITTRGKRKR